MMKVPRFIRVVLIYLTIHFMLGMLFVLLLRAERVEQPILVAFLWPMYLLLLSGLGGVGALLGSAIFLLITAFICLGLSLLVDKMLVYLCTPPKDGSSG